MLSAIFDRNGTGQAEVFVSNVSRGVMAYTAPLDANVAFRLMTNRATNAWIEGPVGEVIVTADIANRSDYHDYLSTKWGAA